MASRNVVFVGNFLYPEGLAETKRIQHMIDAVVSRAGDSARVLLLRQSHPGRDERRLSGQHAGVVYETIGCPMGPGISAVRDMCRYLVRGVAVLREARRSDARNVMYLYAEPNVESILFVIAAKWLGYRIVVDILEDVYLIGPNAPFRSRLKARSAAFTTSRIGWFADAVIVISYYLKEKLDRISQGRFPVQLIPVTVDFSKVSVSPGGFHHPVRILYAGSFGEKDGIENLITAFEQVAARNSDVELVMTGRGAPDRMAQLEQRRTVSPVASRMHYLGFLSDEDYFQALAKCDIPCVVRVASDFAGRGFPFKLGEYLATGRPVVAANVGDLGRYLTDRVNALLCEPGSVAGIVAALEFALADEARALAIGRAGRRVAEQHFSAGTSGELLLAVIDQLP